ncbi:MAG TPA: ABC transporter ATP-binding protein [Candidatus Dormibacteraeota bacterium]|nr:ABC transporter ATP-binding protein [Candidatus Dormibacteraeota bacterium]
MSVWAAFRQDPEKARRGIDLGLVRRAWGFVRPHRAAVLLYLAMICVAALLEVVPALLFRQIVDVALPHRDERALLAGAGALLGVFVAEALLGVGQQWLSFRIGSDVVLALRVTLYRQFQRMPMAFFTRARQGMIESRLIEEVGNAEDLFSFTLSSGLTNLLGLIATFAAMFVLNPFVAAIVLLLAPLALVASEVVGGRSRELNRRQSQLQAELSAHVAERLSVSGALLARIFGGREQDLRRFADQGTAALRNSVALQSFQALFTGALSLTGSLAVVAIYLVGGGAVIGGSLSLGTLIALAALAQRVYGPILHLASLRLNLASGVVALERVVEVLDKEPLVGEPASPVRPAEVRGRVEVDGAWFRYPAPSAASIASLEMDCEGRTLRELPSEPSEWILREVSLCAEPGTVTALVGPTGAGKTTLCYLLARLYDVERGSVRIDGIDVRELGSEVLTEALAMVPQDPHLFHDTIGANLRYARPGASDAELEEACRRARIHEVIEGLPEGYETMTGERGYRFSGGEKQRLAIARAILKNPRVLILDEATSHLDTETESLVQEALGEVMAGRTSFVIAHRLSTVRAADQILVLEGGRIVERGNHGTLLAAGGLYRTLYQAGFPLPLAEEG